MQKNVARREGWLQWVKHWTVSWLNMYYGHSFNTCYYMFIYLHPPSKSQKVIFGICSWWSSAFTRSLAGSKWHFPTLNFYIIVSEKVCETIVWIAMITILQQIGAKTYIPIFMTSFCVLSPLDGEVYINIFKNLPVVILQVNKSV